MIKGIAVDLERANQFDKVKELEDSFLELLATSDTCAHFSSAIESVGHSYQPSDEFTDFKKKLEDESKKSKAASPFVPQNSPFFRQFKEAIWNVHHAGQPMPGEEQEEIVMTSTQCNLLNVTCPLSGKPVAELHNPVRSLNCKHIYEKEAIMHYIKSKNSSGAQCPCPVAGCPKILEQQRVVCDPLLQVEIDELRFQGNQTTQPTVVEDCTGFDED